MTDAPAIPDSSPARILLVDDDRIILDSLGDFLRAEGYDVVALEAIPAAMQVLEVEHFHLVISDVTMPASNGMELLRYVRRHHPELVVILITGYGTIESAVEAIKLGAYDYLTKPVIDDDVRLAVRRALEQQKLVAENRRLREQLAGRYGLDNILGGDHRMAKVFELIEAVADSRTTVLMTGESGTGKSLIARAIHSRSTRAAGPFVEVSCGAMPETLLESELFGHVKGSFTNALSDKAGKFAAADGGTIFLDEISSASPGLQMKLLRVLQERQFEPVGSNQTRQVDARVILATNRDLSREVSEGRFRSDLYYRVNVVSIDLPALRDRPGDIPLLARHFLRKHAAAMNRAVTGFDEEAARLLQTYPWPGNVRELENCMERAALLCRGGTIRAADLPPALLNGSAGATDGSSATPTSGNGALPLPPAGSSLADALADPEKRILQAALARHRGSRQAAAAELQINRTTLFKKMRKYGLLG